MRGPVLQAEACEIWISENQYPVHKLQVAVNRGDRFVFIDFEKAFNTLDHSTSGIRNDEQICLSVEVVLSMLRGHSMLLGNFERI